MSNEHEAPERVYLGRCHPCRSDWDFYVADPLVSRGTIEFIRADLAFVLPPPGSEAEAEMASLALSHMMREIGRALAETPDGATIHEVRINAMRIAIRAALAQPKGGGR